MEFSGLESLKDIARKEEKKLKLLCEQLKNAQVKCVGKNSDIDALRSKHAMLKAESKELENLKTEGIPLNDDLLIILEKRSMKKQITSLKDFLEHLQFTKGKLLEKKEKLQKCLDVEQKQASLFNDAQVQVNELAQGIDVDEKIQDLKEKIKVMDALNDFRIYQLRILMARLFPEVDELTVADVARKDTLFFERNTAKKSLLEIIQLLVNASLYSSDPWITVDSSIWAPYIELLTRIKLVVMHPTNNHLMRLERFHE